MLLFKNNKTNHENNNNKKKQKKNPLESLLYIPHNWTPSWHCPQTTSPPNLPFCKREHRELHLLFNHQCCERHVDGQSRASVLFLTSQLQANSRIVRHSYWRNPRWHRINEMFIFSFEIILCGQNQLDCSNSHFAHLFSLINTHSSIPTLKTLPGKGYSQDPSLPS